MRKRNKAGLKQILFMLVMLLLISLTTGDLQAAEGLRLVASEEEGAGGEIISVIIRAENAVGSEGGQFILNFDPALVRPVAVESGELVKSAASGLYMANLEYAEDQLMFMWITAAADTAEDGDICIISFELFSEGETRLTFEEIIISPGETIAASPIDGKITIDDSGVEQGNNGHQDKPGSAGINVMAMGIGLIVTALIAATGYSIFKRAKKSAH